MIRVGTPQKYKPTKLSELPKLRKIRPTNITNHTVVKLLTVYNLLSFEVSEY